MSPFFRCFLLCRRDHLRLRRPIYRKTAAFGHFGRTEDTFSWEATDKVEELRQHLPVAEAVAR